MPRETDRNESFVRIVAANQRRIHAFIMMLVPRAADWNGPRQQDDIKWLIAGGVAALFVNPVDPDLIEKNLRHAANAGIPCVVVDTQMPQQDTVGCQVLSDNREAGRLAARIPLLALRAWMDRFLP